MRRVVAVAVLSGLVLAFVACRSGDSTATASSHAKSDSSFRNLGKRDSSPLSAWNEAAVKR
jgi:hypothetical protein